MPTYDAFVSYSHAEDREVAGRLVAGVEKFGKPWYRVRSLRLFLDRNSLSADPGLWTLIERALADAKWFILVTSPRAAESRWVDREIEWWLANRSAGRLLIVVTGGNLVWDPGANDFDPDSSTALPPRLLGAFEEEPHWVSIPRPSGGRGSPGERDLREAIVDVATPLRGIPKERLVAVAEREHRRTMRLVRGAILVLSGLLIAAVVAGLIALHQRGAAVKAARVALSRQVAAASESAAATDLDVSMLLAVQAIRIDSNPQTRAALFAADTASPKLVGFLDAGGKVEHVVGSGDGRAVAAGLVDGRVLLWPSGRGRPQQLFDLPRRVSSLAISEDGSVVAAADRTRIVLWRRGHAPQRLPVPPGQHGDAVGLSPSGKTVVYHGATPNWEGTGSLTVAPVSHPADRAVHPDPVHEQLWYGWIVVPSDGRALILSAGDWEWRDLRDWSVRKGTFAGIGAHDYAEAVSTDGHFATWTNGGTEIPVWRIRGHRRDEGDLTVDASVTGQKALALSPDGSEIAVAAAGAVYVTPVMSNQKSTGIGGAVLDPAEQPTDLVGQSATTVSFFEGDTHLLSASGREIGIWDLDQLDRLAHTSRVPLEYGCTECGPPAVSVSPDGRRVAVVDGFGLGGFVQPLSRGAARTKLPSSEFLEYSYGRPLWQPSSGFVSFPIWPSTGGSNPPVLPPYIHAWPTGRGEENGLSASLMPDGKTAIVVDQSGGVYWQNAATGEEIDSSPGSASVFKEGEEGVVFAAAVSPSGRLLALSSTNMVTVEKLPGREVVGRIRVGQLASLAFAGDHLLVQRQDGSLEVWNEYGTQRQWALAGNEGYDASPVSDAEGTLMARSLNNGGIGLYDLETGDTLATFATPGTSIFFRTGLALTPGGDKLVAVSELPAENAKGGELVWRDISEAGLTKVACEAAGRNLTREEWRAFVGGAAPPSDLSCH